MTPPVVDPLHADAGPAPSPEPANPPVAAPVVNPAPLAAQPPNTANPAPQPAESASSYDPNSFLGRFHFVIGGGYNFGTRVNPSAEPFSSAAPSYTGGSLYFQPSYSLFNPSGIFDLRLGANLATHILSIPRSPGSTSSSVNGLALAGLVEGNLNIHQHFGIGLNASLGYMGLMSSDADVGAPFTASFDWGEQGGLYVGAQLYALTFNQAIRLGVALDSMPTGFGLPTAPGQPDLLVGYGPAWTIFAGLDPFRIVDFVQRGGRSSAPAEPAQPASR
jgi:hypothetical protein